MERDFDTFDPNEALVDEGRNLYYPANWQKGDTVYVLNAAACGHSAGCPCGAPFDMDDDVDGFDGLEARKGLDCE
jgi:hypothetical protein